MLIGLDRRKLYAFFKSFSLSGLCTCIQCIAPRNNCIFSILTLDQLGRKFFYQLDFTLKTEVEIVSLLRKVLIVEQDAIINWYNCYFCCLLINTFITAVSRLSVKLRLVGMLGQFSNKFPYDLTQRSRLAFWPFCQLTRNANTVYAL